MMAQKGEDEPSSLIANPTHGMSIIYIEMKIWIPIKKISKCGEGRKISVHGIQAIHRIPDLAISI